MSKEIEIEKKYKVKKLPENIEEYEHITIEQSYFNKGGAPIRIRKFISSDEIKCLISKKFKSDDESIKNIEYNIDITEELYDKFVEAREGKIIKKTRYKIPLQEGLYVDLDVFHGFLEGVCIAEIEYESIEQAESYKIPEWIEEVNFDKELITNIYMATKLQSINELKDFLLKEK